MTVLHMNSLVGVGFGRQAFEVFGGDGTLVNPWRLIALGDPSSEVRIAEPEGFGTYTIFPFDVPLVPPAGFSPTGDVVAVRPNAHQYDTFPSPPTGTLDLGAEFQAVTWAWAGSSELGGGAFPLLYVVGRDGRPDRWFFAVPAEVRLVKKNPAFP